jgi:hypothetical protein
MPFGDGTGPLGLGPMTGRGAGYCAGFNIPGLINNWVGRRLWGKGGGRGFYRRFRQTMPVAPEYPANNSPVNSGNFYVNGAGTADAELTELKAQAEYLKRSLEEISQRIGAFENRKERNAE